MLALSQNGARLVEVSPDAPPAEVRVPGMPRVQGSEGKKLRLRQHARRADEALRPTLAGLDLPLILAGTGPLESIFRSVSSYPHLAPGSIPDSPDTKTDGELADASRQVLDEHCSDELTELRTR